MRPVRTVVEKDLCLVVLVWPLTFLPHLVCAPLNAPLGTMLMRAKCVKVSAPVHLFIVTYLQYCTAFKLTVL